MYIDYKQFSPFPNPLATNRMTPPFNHVFSPLGVLFPIAACIFLTTSTAPARGDLLVYEGFDYPAGDLADQSGGTGWSEPWHGVSGAHAHGAVVADSLNVSPAISTSGGHMQTNDGDSALMRGFSNPLFKANGVTWISFLARNDSGGTDATYSFLKFAASGGGDDSSIRIAKDFYGKNWEVAMGSQNQDLGVAADSNAVLFVLRIEVTGKPGGDSVQVFVNPPITSAPTAPTGQLTGITLKPLDQAVIQAGTGVKTFSYDEIRIGTTFADVVPAAAAPAPAAAK
jgi:hypothetical protein